MDFHMKVNTWQTKKMQQAPGHLWRFIMQIMLKQLIRKTTGQWEQQDHVGARVCQTAIEASEVIPGCDEPVWQGHCTSLLLHD